MMLNKKTIRNNIIVFAVLSIFFGTFGWAGVGLIACLMAFVNFLAGIISLLLRRKTNGLTLLLCSGVLLLIGFSVCTAAPISFH